MLQQEQIEIVNKILKNFIFQIRSYGVSNLVYTYFISDFSQQFAKNRVKILHNFDSLKLQFKRGILSKDNNYWNFQDSEIKLVENIVNTKEKDFDTFKDYIEELFKCDLSILEKELLKEEQESLSKEEERLKNILKEKYEIYKEIIPKIINDNLNLPCKSDKIKALLEIYLNTEEIFVILNGYEKWMVQRGYVEKYKKERIEAISEGKIKPLSKEIAISKMLKVLK